MSREYDDEAAQLKRVLESRTIIGEAKGILMERYSLGSEEAFTVLVRYSNHTNVKVREVAAHLVETRELPPYGVRETVSASEAGSLQPH